MTKKKCQTKIKALKAQIVEKEKDFDSKVSEINEQMKALKTEVMGGGDTKVLLKAASITNEDFSKMSIVEKTRQLAMQKARNLNYIKKETMSKFKNVAISLPSNTYAGESYAEYMTPALLKPKGIVDRGLVTPIQGFKDKIALLGADAALELKNPSAVFSSQSSGLVRNEKSLQLVKYELQLQTDYDALRTTWEATELGAGSFD